VATQVGRDRGSGRARAEICEFQLTTPRPTRHPRADRPAAEHRRQRLGAAAVRDHDRAAGAQRGPRLRPPEPM